MKLEDWVYMGINKIAGMNKVLMGRRGGNTYHRESGLDSTTNP